MNVHYPTYPPDAILSLVEIAQALHLDRKTVSRLAYSIGGRRFGRRWRFRWGTVMESFNADKTETEGQLLACESGDQWSASGQQAFSGWPNKRAGMGRGEKLGGATEKGIARANGKTEDSFGLRAALGVG